MTSVGTDVLRQLMTRCWRNTLRGILISQAIIVRIIYSIEDISIVLELWVTAVVTALESISIFAGCRECDKFLLLSRPACRRRLHDDLLLG